MKYLTTDGAAMNWYEDRCVGYQEHISGWSAWEMLYWLNEKQAKPRRCDNAKRTGQFKNK
jgi:hypothetical protein